VDKVNSIAIVGGGSSGWMVAATLINSFPEKDITLIESPNISTIGVGESTQAKITQWAQSIGIDHKDFMQYTEASYKMSIKFTDFHKKGDGGFHYPFGRFYGGDAEFGSKDWHMKKTLYPETPIQDYCNSFFPQMALVNKNKINENQYNIFNDYDFDKDTAFHFNATKFAFWLRDRYSIPRGVKHLKKEITEVKTNENGISGLVLDDNSEFKADLYIDCTGFKALLIKETFNIPFEDISEYLPCNSAWAVQIPYVDPEKEVENFTNCTALSSGWVWNTPLYSRIGTGYVYSDKFISDEDALLEFKEYLKNKKEPIYAPERITEDLKFRNIKMRTGVHKKLWHKNMVAIGLSAGFIEPLESNGLYTVHEFIKILVRSLDKGFVNQFDVDSFNYECRNIFYGFMKFVQMHYTLSKRRDSDFWKHMTSLEIDLEKPSGYNQVSSTRTAYSYEYETNSGIHCIAVGHNNLLFGNYAIKEFENENKSTNFELAAKGFIFRSDKSKEKWNKEAENSENHYVYLKKKFHSDGDINEY
jgi:flavin-dependent dehydrogenase